VTTTGAAGPIGPARSRRAEDIVYAVLGEYAGISRDDHPPGSELVEDVGLQSLDVAEIVALVEDAADVPVEVDDIASLVRIADLVALADRSLRADLGPLTVHEQVARRIAEAPDAIAVVCGDAQLTYLELGSAVNRLARHLRSLRVARGDLVGLCLDPGVDAIVGPLAVLAAGAAYVPVDGDAWPAGRIGSILSDAGCRLVVSHRRFDGRLGVGPDVEVVRLDDPATARALRALEATPPAGAAARPGDLAYVVYTSGSTGEPKGVMVEHRSVVNYLQWIGDLLPCRRGAPLIGSLAFDLAATALLGPLAAGGSVAVPPASRGLPDGLLDGPGRFGFVKATPSHLRTVRAGAIPRRAVTDVLVLGGESLTGDLLDRWSGAVAEGFVNHYGPTEATIGCCARVVPAGERIDGPVPIGRPGPGMAAHVLDGALERVPPGVIGELYVGGVGVARGYLGRPGATAERFLPDPFSDAPGARMYRTGDLVRRRRDGDLVFVGRSDEQVRVRGHRVEPGDVAAGLLRHPRVDACAVVARHRGHDDTQLVAYVQGDGWTVSDLRAFLGGLLPAYMVPGSFVAMDALPLLANGKVDRGALPPPDDLRPAVDAEFVEPRDAAEALMAAIWCEVLGLDRVGADDSFFELGGHSLLATRVAHETSSALGVDVPLATLFHAHTVAEQADAVRPLVEVLLTELEAVERMADHMAGEGAQHVGAPPMHTVTTGDGCEGS
jgi:amino acid adenylation domain-containing protein